MDGDVVFALVVGGICAYLLGGYTFAEVAAWNRRRAARACRNAEIREARLAMRAKLLAETEQAIYDREFIGIVAEWRANR